MPIESKNLKTLWFTSSYPRSKTDSASIFLRKLANSLASETHEIHILSPDHIDIEETFQDPFIIKHNFRYFFPRNMQKLAFGSGTLPNLKKNKWLYIQAPFFILSLFLSGWRLIHIIKPTTIHAHWIFPQGFIAALLGKIYNIPVITTAHGGDAFALKSSLIAKIKKWTINNSTAWTSNTNATANAFGNKLPLPNIIPMGIDYKSFSSGDSENLRSNIPKDTLIFLFVGRLVEKKGVSDILKAYSLLPDYHKEKTQLWIVGDGTESQKLASLSKLLNIDKHVQFFGKLANEELPDYYSAADIFIAPSIIDSCGDTEGQGVMLLEALASGTAIITTQTGGITEVISHNKTGIIIPPESPTKLKIAIQLLLNNRQKRNNLCKNAQQHAQQYDWRIISDKFTQLYKNNI